MATLSHHHGGDDDSGSAELSLVAPDESAAVAAAYGSHMGDDSLLLPNVQPPPSVPAMMYHAAAEYASQTVQHHYAAAVAAAAAHHHTMHLQQAPPPPPPNAYSYGAAPAAAAAAAAAAAGHLHSLTMPVQSGAASPSGSLSPSQDGSEKAKKKRGPRQTSICHHGKRRSQCVQCYDEGTGGSTICKHRRQRYACRPCFDEGQPTNSLCIHRTIRIKCKECTPERPNPRAYRPRAKTSSGKAERGGGQSQLPPPPLGYMNGMLDPNGHYNQAHLMGTLATPAPTPMTTPVVQPHTTGQLRMRKGWSRLGKTSEDGESSDFQCELCGSGERLLVGPGREVYCFDCHIKSDPYGDPNQPGGGNNNGNGSGSSRSKRSGGGSGGSRSSSAQTPPDTPKRTRGNSSGNGGANGSAGSKRRRMDDGQRAVDGDDDDTEDMDMDGNGAAGDASDQEPSPPTSSASGKGKKKVVLRKTGHAANTCSECGNADLSQAFKDSSGDPLCENCHKWLSKKGYRAQAGKGKSKSSQPRRSARARAAGALSDDQTNTETASDDGEQTDSAGENAQAVAPFAGAPPFNLPAGMPVPPYYLVWYPSGSNPTGAAASTTGGATAAGGATATPYAWFPYYGGALYPQAGQAGAAAGNPTGDADASSAIPAAAAALLSLQQDPAVPSNAGSPTEEGAAAAIPPVPFYMSGEGGIPVPIPSSMLAAAAAASGAGGQHTLIALTPEAAAAMTSQAALAAAAAVGQDDSLGVDETSILDDKDIPMSVSAEVIAAAVAAAGVTLPIITTTGPSTAALMSSPAVSGNGLKVPGVGGDVPLTAPASPVQEKVVGSGRPKRGAAAVAAAAAAAGKGEKV